jgi:maleylpyruvate isomerase
MSDVGRLLNEHVVGCAAAHQRLLAALDALTEEQCRGASHLPGWTRGHVLNHLARNADSHVHLLQCASRGEVGEQYQGGAAARNAGIEDGAGRSAEQLVADVRRGIYALEAQWAAPNAQGWQGEGVNSARAAIPMSDIVFLRWREVEVHMSDLDVNVSWQDWSAEYVRYELERQVMLWRSRKSMGMTVLPEAALRLPPNHRLAWLLRRVDVEGLATPDGL